MKYADDWFGCSRIEVAGVGVVVEVGEVAGVGEVTGVEVARVEEVGVVGVADVTGYWVSNQSSTNAIVSTYFFWL